MILGKNQEIRRKFDKIRLKQRMIERAWNVDGNKEMLQFFVDILPRTMQAERCSIFVHDATSKQTWLQCGTDSSERRVELPSKGCLVGEVLNDGNVRIDNDIANRTNAMQMVAPGSDVVMQNVLCVPIRSLSGKHVSGAIQIVNKLDGQPFDEEDRLLLEKIARHMQTAIENIYLSHDAVKITRTMQEKIDMTEFFTRVMVGFMVVSVLIVIVTFTPHIIEIFSRHPTP
ncbi:MAG: GAF domain-containing protein [Magnetococcales bacterium]|nr:GAF domain-containing protein [Magnetococcales bacterium]